MANKQAPFGQPGSYNATPATRSDGDPSGFEFDASGNVKVTNATLGAGEDLTNNVTKVEERFSYSLVAADTQIKAGAGFIHSLTFSQNDAAPTAGTIIAYDSLTETGTQIFNWTLTTAVFVPFSVIIDATFATGLYIGFTTTADVNVTVSYR